MDKHIGLYIHIPFCKSKCYYCDFASYANRNEQMEPYILSLEKEMKLYSKLLQNKKIDTVFIGGGTPTVLPLDLMQRILSSIFSYFNIENQAEITIESNPGTLNIDTLQLLKEHHVNRLSMGLQAYQNQLLKSIGRIHTVEEFIDNFYLARKLGFKNINIDLMFSLPAQTTKDWVYTLRSIGDLNPEHISCYSLIIEENTPFGKWEEEGKIKELDDEIDRSMYHYGQWYLNNRGYQHYEISNFSKPGFLSRHNLRYWKYEEYIGMGLGAHSFFNGERYHNTYNLKKYIQFDGEISKIKEEVEVLPLSIQYAEYIFLGLRLLEGISVKDFHSRFQISFYELYGEKVEEFIEKGLLDIQNGNIRLTSRGLDVCNTVFTEFLPE